LLRAFNPGYGGDAAQFLFAFTGRTEAMQIAVSHMNDSIDPGQQLAARFGVLLFQRRLCELSKLVEQSTLKHFRLGGYSGIGILSIGARPIAELHGLAKLLDGDRAAAERDGRIMLDFVANEPRTKWDTWHLRFLAAEGAMFVGNKSLAIAETRTALAMTPHKINVGASKYASATAARIFAWSGAEEEAVDLLDSLSTNYPGLGPAEITRDPLYSIPLAKNHRYKILEKRLESEIALNMKLLWPTL